tara:strand:+ start:80 stop:241 length:162 start_codon:yes stop_codon:yes gene_type:complete
VEEKVDQMLLQEMELQEVQVVVELIMLVIHRILVVLVMQEGLLLLKVLQAEPL